MKTPKEDSNHQERKTTRRHHSAEEKVRLLRLHLVEGKAISAICEDNGIHPTAYGYWQLAQAVERAFGYPPRGWTIDADATVGGARAAGTGVDCHDEITAAGSSSAGDSGVGGVSGVASAVRAASSPTDGSLARVKSEVCGAEGSLGACDMVNFLARDTVPARYEGRTFYRHNDNVTLMRTSAEECRAIGIWIAEKLNECRGKSAC